MSVIKLHDKYFKPFISAESIADKVVEMAQRVKRDMGNEIPLFVGIMNGSFIFAAVYSFA